MKNNIIDKNYKNDKLIIKEDSNIYIRNDFANDDFYIEIHNCNVFIYDLSYSKKQIVSKNSNVNYFCITYQTINSKIKFDIYKGVLYLNLIDIFENDNILNANFNLKSNDSKVNIESVSIASNNNEKKYDFSTFIFGKNCDSNINCFAMVKDHSFINCKMFSKIEKGSINSKISQNSKILLMDNDSKGKNEPMLKIEENSISAKHSASIGMIDEKEIFYLMSRGISKNTANNLISIGKISYLVEKIKNN